MLNFLKNNPANVIVNMGAFSYSTLYKHLFEQLLFTALVWNSRAGIDFKTGLLKVSNLINSKKLKTKLKMASNYCGQGLAVVESIKRSDLPITTELQQLLKIAEESGRWEQAVDHYLKQQRVMLDMKIDSALEWLPKVYYFFIVVFVGSVIV
ncbi:MAG: type II secretion system F family protein [Gammaproteobacteria bacterium]|nr:type II secretion system F family protein [Gammaproteobacteria bacterium]